MTHLPRILSAIMVPAAMVALLCWAASPAQGLTLYVAPAGNDAWSGRMPAPNAAATDGPLATITRARDAIRQWKAANGGLKEPVTVEIRGGTYFLPQTITFTADDSGTRECPIVYRAAPGQQPVISGGKRIGGWKPHEGKIQVAALPDVLSGKWNFRSLFVNGRRQIRARYPNFDPTDPYRKGFVYVDKDPDGFGLAVGNIHNPGDWMEYRVEILADGDYAFWIYYGSLNRPYGTLDMAGRTTLSVDGKTPAPLENLPDSGGWGTLRWSQSLSLRLTKGTHLLRWQNVKGGGLTLAAYALTDDPRWKPLAVPPPPAAAGKHLLVIQAASFVRSHGKQLTVSGTTEGSSTEFHYAPGTFQPAWVKAPEAEIHLFQSSSCRAFMEIVSLVKVDPQGRTLTVGGPECVTPIRPGDRYFVENVPEALDSPGEWYLDRRAGRLFYQPQEPLTGETEVVAPLLGRLVQVLGDVASRKPVGHLTFSGLTFQETDYSPDDGCVGYGMGSDGVLYLRDAAECTIENCAFRNIGKYAVCVCGGRANAIRGNDVAMAAEGGVLLERTAGNTVIDNHIHDCGQVYKHIGGVVLEGDGTSDNLVAHNLIHDMSRYGISLKSVGSRNRLEYNRILNTSLETHDTGGIEVTQGEKDFRSHSVIRNNVIGDTIGYSADGPKPVFLSWGIYLDSFAGGYTVTHNVTYRSSHGGLMLQGGKDNLIENNVFVDGAYSQVYVANCENNSTGLRFQRNIVAYAAPDAALFACGRVDQEVIRIDRNLYFPPGGKTPALRGCPSLAAWQKQGFDRNSLVADPRFVDPAHDNYALKLDSPAFQLGFQPIDTSRVGLLHDRCRCPICPAAAYFGLAGPHPPTP